MYSRKDILNAVKKGEIKITPFSKTDLQPNSYKLHLDNEIAVAKKGLIDPLECKDYSKFYKKLKIKNKFNLRPEMFILARTREKLTINKKAAAMVNGRSSIARLGVTVTQTAPMLHSGHGFPVPRKVVLEIKNEAGFTVRLTPGMVIAEVSFFKLNTPTDMLYDSFGRYGVRKNKNALLPVKE